MVVGVEEIMEHVMDIRKQLGLRVDVRPRIVDVVYREEDDALFIIVGDRTDRVILVGPGSWVAVELKKRLGVRGLGIKALTDIQIKQTRVREAVQAIKEVSRATGIELLEERIAPIVENELKYPRQDFVRFEELDQPGVVVAYSGGVDSTASLYLCKLAGLRPVAITSAPGTWMVPKIRRRIIDRIVEELGVEHAYVSDPEYEDLLEKVLQNRTHPCGQCRKILEKVMIKEARERGVKIVIFGDLLPTGAYSVRVRNGVVFLALPAAMALTKTETEIIARKAGHPGLTFYYGCPLLHEVHRRFPGRRYASMLRVLRKVRAGILEPGQGIRYIKDILSY